MRIISAQPLEVGGGASSARRRTLGTRFASLALPRPPGFQERPPHPRGIWRSVAYSRRQHEVAARIRGAGPPPRQRSRAGSRLSGHEVLDPPEGYDAADEFDEAEGDGGDPGRGHPDDEEGGRPASGRKEPHIAQDQADENDRGPEDDALGQTLKLEFVAIDAAGREAGRGRSGGPLRTRRLRALRRGRERS